MLSIPPAPWQRRSARRSLQTETRTSGRSPQPSAAALPWLRSHGLCKIDSIPSLSDASEGHCRPRLGCHEVSRENASHRAPERRETSWDGGAECRASRAIADLIDGSRETFGERG